MWCVSSSVSSRPFLNGPANQVQVLHVLAVEMHDGRERAELDQDAGYGDGQQQDGEAHARAAVVEIIGGGSLVASSLEMERIVANLNHPVTVNSLPGGRAGLDYIFAARVKKVEVKT